MTNADYIRQVVDDIYLQGILAKLKQRTWWKENAPAEKYEMDCAAALFIHAFSWSVMITMPYIVLMLVRNDYKVISVWLSALLVNTFVHAIVDRSVHTYRTGCYNRYCSG